MNGKKKIDPEEALRRVGEFLDEELPTDEEARAICADMGADIPVFTARILAMIAAHAAGRLAKEDEAPPSHVAVRRARAPAVRHRVRR